VDLALQLAALTVVWRILAHVRSSNNSSP
jgi:hypothetical protein